MNTLKMKEMQFMQVGPGIKNFKIGERVVLSWIKKKDPVL